MRFGQSGVTCDVCAGTSGGPVSKDGAWIGEARMETAQQTGSYATRLSIYLGAALFLVALLVSAILVPGLRLLHAFQALIYVAVIILARRNSAFGYGAGFTIAVAWNAMGLFITHLIQTGTVAFWSSLHTGRIEQPVPMMVALGAMAHFILIGATLVAVLRYDSESRKWWKFAGGGVLSLAYLALIVALARPH